MTFTPQKYSKMYGNIKIIIKHSVKTLEQAALYELLPGFCLIQGLPFVKSFFAFYPHVSDNRPVSNEQVLLTTSRINSHLLLIR